MFPPVVAPPAAPAVELPPLPVLVLTLVLNPRAQLALVVLALIVFLVMHSLYYDAHDYSSIRREAASQSFLVSNFNIS